MNKWLRYFMAGAVLVAGIAAIGATGSDIRAATLSLMTGPAGSNPAASPQNLPDYNKIITNVNANAAFAGTGTPSQAVGVVPTVTSSFGSPGTTYQLLQVVAGVFTTTTGTATCNVAGATRCLGILDNSGVLRWIGLN